MRVFSEVLRQHYDQSPDRTCITLLFSGRPEAAISYRDLIHGSAGYAAAYNRLGIKKGEVVLLILQHGKELVHAYFGAVLQGAIPSIMPFLTEKLLPDRYRHDLEELIAHTAPTAIVTFQEFEAEVRAALRPGEDSVKAVIVCDGVHADAVKPCLPDFSSLQGFQCQGEDIVLLQHSSGTTGLQKGVALSHRSVFNQLEAYAEAIRLKGDDVIVSWLPLYHDMGLIACFLMPILLGVPVVQMSPFDWVRAPYRLLQAITSYQGTLTWLPNFAYNFCAQKIRDRDLEGVDLSTWRTSINCSEPVRYKSHQLFFERFKAFGLRMETLQTCYGMAENVFAVTQSDLDQLPRMDEIDADSFSTDLAARTAVENKPAMQMLSSGKPIRGTQIRVVDDKGEDLPERKVGEIILKGSCLLSGYYKRPDVTRKSFLKGGWYKTGDYGYLLDGDLFVAGRKKDLIIVGGKNIYPQDLEQLAHDVPGVHPGRASAFGVYNDATGTEDVILVAEVDEEDDLVRQSIADAIRAAVTRGSAVALRFVYIVSSHWLVKTSSGKTARSANRDKFLKEMQAKALEY